MSGATSLDAIFSQSEVSVKKMQNEWHRAFIAINETLGGLEDKKARAERGEKVFAGADPTMMGGGGGLTPKGKKNLIIAAIVVVIVGLLAAIPQVRDIYVDSFRQVFGM